MPFMIGSGFTNPSGSAYEAESETIFAAFSSQPDATRKGHINTLVASLKSGGVWTKLDVLWVLAAADSQAASINWKTPASFALTETNSPTFTADAGYAGNGTSSYLATGWDPATNGSQYTQNSATLFVWSNTDLRQNAALFGGGHGATGRNSYINPWNAAVDSVSHGNNGAASNQYSPGAADGLFTNTRTGSSGYDIYRNTTNLGTQTDASVGLGDVDFRIGSADLPGVATQYSTRQVAAAGAGSGLSSGEITTLYNALNTYLTAV